MIVDGSGRRAGARLMLALRFALRELRGGIAGLRIVLACLALGVAVIAGVGSLRVAIERGLDADGSRILGGDLEVDGGAQPLPDSLRDWLRARGARLSDVVVMRSMLVAPSGERQLIELKAVDAAWPLVGTADPTRRVDSAALAEGGHTGSPPSRWCWTGWACIRAMRSGSATPRFVRPGAARPKSPTAWPGHPCSAPAR